jgi:hypothetical protein
MHEEGAAVRLVVRRHGRQRREGKATAATQVYDWVRGAVRAATCGQEPLQYAGDGCAVRSVWKSLRESDASWQIDCAWTVAVRRPAHGTRNACGAQYATWRTTYDMTRARLDCAWMVAA